MIASKLGRRKILEDRVKEIDAISQELKIYRVCKAAEISDINDHCNIRIPVDTKEIHIEYYSISNRVSVYFRDVFQQAAGIGMMTMHYESALKFEEELNTRLAVRPTIRKHTFN